MSNLKYILSIISLCIGINLNAQEIVSDNLDPLFQNSDLYKGKNTGEVMGSPFLNEEWIEGKIILTDGREYNNIQLRYNAATKNLHALIKGQELILNTKNIKRFEFETSNSELRNFEKYKVNNEIGFYEVLNDSKSLKLLVSHNKRLVKAVNSNSSYGSSTSKKDKYTDANEFLIFSKNIDHQNIKQFSGRKKELYKLYPAHKDEIKDFIKENKLNSKEPKDLAKIIDFISTL